MGKLGAEVTNGIVQPKLIGGLGNQMHQYACARAYAHFIGARFECPPWAGSQVFELDDPLPSTDDLTDVNDRGDRIPDVLRVRPTNVRLGGYFQANAWVQTLSRVELKRWFRIRERWLRLITLPPKPYTAAHLRRGDYVNHPMYCTVSRKSYIWALYDENVDGRAVHWCSDDSPRIVEGIPPSISYLPDFALLAGASLLLRANSTFSWWAAVLSNARVLAPIVNNMVGEADCIFVEGNWPRCAHTARIGLPVEDLHLPE